VEACTGGGGRHLLFRVDGHVPCSVGKLGRGVDVRGDGGLIVAAPSVHASGRAYGWELSSDPAEVEVADAPAWLVDACRASVRAPRRVGVGVRGRGKVVLGEPIPDGERNATLYSRACSLRALGLDEDELAVALGEAPGESARVFRFPRLVNHVLEHRAGYLRDALMIPRSPSPPTTPPRSWPASPTSARSSKPPTPSAPTCCAPYSAPCSCGPSW